MNTMKKFQISAYDIPYQEEDDELLKEIYSYEDIKNLKCAAQQENFSCLSFISLESKTYFNEKQTLEILKIELPKLQFKENINIALLEHIIKIASLVQDGYSFLKFEPQF